MSSEDEIAAYLECLLDHRARCILTDCASCQTLRGILDGIEARIFGSVVFPQAGDGEKRARSLKRVVEPIARERRTAREVRAS